MILKECRLAFKMRLKQVPISLSVLWYFLIRHKTDSAGPMHYADYGLCRLRVSRHDRHAGQSRTRSRIKNVDFDILFRRCHRCRDHSRPLFKKTQTDLLETVCRQQRLVLQPQGQEPVYQRSTQREKLSITDFGP